jgi:hypothetical protein
MLRLSEPRFKLLDDNFELALKSFFEPKETRSQFLLNFCIFIINLDLFALIFFIFTDLFQVLNFVNEMEYDLCSYDIV